MDGSLRSAGGESSFELIFAQSAIDTRIGPGITPEQIKLRNLELTDRGVAHLFDLLPQASQRDGILNPGESEMRRELPYFLGHAQRGERFVGIARQFFQRFSTLDTGPENARRTLVWEPT